MEMLRVLLFVLCMLPWITMCQTPTLSGDDIAESFGSRLSANWKPCAPNRFKQGFHPLARCFPVELLKGPAILSGNISAACDVAVPSHSSGNVSCTSLSKSVLQVYWCRLGNGRSPVWFNASQSVAAVTAPEWCSDGAAGHLLLTRAADFALRSPESNSAWIDCRNPLAPLVRGCRHHELNIGDNFSVGQCSENHLQLECSFCQPYFEPNTVAQPYHFVLVAGLKVTIVVLIQLFLLDHSGDRIRKRMKRFAKERPAPKADHKVEFTSFVIRHLLCDGLCRIRLRISIANRDAYWAVKWLKKRFENKNETPITPEERKSSSARPPLLFNAPFSLAKCVAPHFNL